MTYEPWEGEGYRVSPHNFAPEVRQSYKFREPMVVEDATFLKMDHLEGSRLYSADEYREVGRLLEEARVPETDFLTDGYNGTPKGDSILEGLYAVANSGVKLKLRTHAYYTIWRPGEYKERIDRQANCGANEITMAVVPARVLRGYRVDMTHEEATRELNKRLEELPEAIQYAKSKGLDVTVSYSFVVMESTENLIDIMNCYIQAGADRLALVDSKGGATTDATRYYISRVREGLTQDLPIIYHAHDDFGLATANSLAAACEGAWPEVSVNGVGDRGFASLEEYVLCLEMLYGVRTGIDLRVLPKLCYAVERITGIPNPPFKPVTGEHINLPPNASGLSGLLQGGNWLDLDCSQFEPRVVGRRPQWAIWYATLLPRTVQAKLQQIGLPDDEMAVEAVTAAVKQGLDSQGNKYPVMLSEAEVERIARETLASEA